MEVKPVSGVPITLNELRLWYGETPVLRGINAQMPARKVTAVVGPSGCGKSSMLRCINRMAELTPGARVAGSVLIGKRCAYARGVDVTEVRRRVGLIAQRPTPLPMSIFDNVAYGPRIHGIRDKEQLHSIVERALTSAGLWHEVRDRLWASPHTLSIGQQQRLCLARGLAVEPDVLLFDEPTASLDPVSALRVEQEILALKRRYTCVIVTHNLQQALRIADYAIFMHKGEIAEQGPAEQVLRSPTHAYTQAYIDGSGI
jgi:phosphate transport system ATP-binding protein